MRSPFVRIFIRNFAIDLEQHHVLLEKEKTQQSVLSCPQSGLHALTGLLNVIQI